MNKENSKLSAEAATFVPSHNSEKKKHLPKYLTNCYPFVSNDVNQKEPPISNSVPPVRIPVFAVSPVASASVPCRHHSVLPYDAMIPMISPGVFVNRSPAYYPVPALYPMPVSQYQKEGHSKKFPNSPRKSLPKSPNLKKNQKVPRSKSLQSRTVILVDCAIQTDFPDSIAYQKLSDKANTLYAIKHNLLETDSEGLDSDSGYSSPMHRKMNQNHAGGATLSYSNALMRGNSGRGASSTSKESAATISSFHSSSAKRSSRSSSTHCSHRTAAVSPSSVAAKASGELSSNNGSAKTPGRDSGGSALFNADHSVDDADSTGEHLAVPVSCCKAAAGKMPTKEGISNPYYQALVSGPLKPVAMKNFGPKSVAAKPSMEEPQSGNVKRRKRRRKKVEEVVNNDDVCNVELNEFQLEFDDQIEFPELTSAVSGIQGASIRTEQQLDTQESDYSSEDELSSCSGGKESKVARKRRRRREQADRAAEAELAEIHLQQHVLRATKVQSNRKSEQPLSLNIGQMLELMKNKPAKQSLQNPSQSGPSKNPKSVANPLDSTAPIKRGKEKEIPRQRKPTTMKRVICMERESKRPEAISDTISPSDAIDMISSKSLEEAKDPSPLINEKCLTNGDGAESKSTPISADMSPISQTSPVSMSPLSGSPCSSGLTSPVVINNEGEQAVKSKIHSRRFREYCSQMLDKKIDQCCHNLLQNLVRFQEKLFHKDPIKAKSKRRIVLGLREVTKHLRLKKIKCVIISPNLERIQSKGGLDDVLNNIIDMCSEQEIPFVFALSRRALGRACAKLVPVSVAGVFNYEGSEEQYAELIALTNEARNQYREVLEKVEKEFEPGRSNLCLSNGLPAHMAHSRTPSGCSAISFISSILSEPPISENYPHSEPETDERGYEIEMQNIDEGAEADEEVDPDDEATTKASLHSNSVTELNHDVASQHSSKTLESNHSGKTVKRSPCESSSTRDVNWRSLENQRIESWIANSSKHMDSLNIN